ncbi:MAG: hypothetical protein IJ272_08790 [Clostridia bacterium]|nr:hypothetical protein [Clostridia bacterium]
MEFDRNYMGYGHMPNCMETCPGQCFKWDNKQMDAKMPPYMHGKCMEKWDDTPDMCSKYLNPYHNMPGQYMMRTDMHPMHHMHHMHQNMEPVENMCGKTYKVLIVHVHKTMHKMMMENMGVMPKAISKDKFNKEMNDMICEVMKREDEIKKLVVIDRSETEEGESTDRVFCPFCNGLLRDTLSILFVTELLRGGCTFCY